MSTAALPGFRDFYPTEFAERAALARSWRDVARRYGFTEYDGPPLEPTELYTKKSGEEIVGQLYAFTDKGGRSVALRPEMTPTFTRMVAARASHGELLARVREGRGHDGERRRTARVGAARGLRQLGESRLSTPFEG